MDVYRLEVFNMGFEYSARTWQAYLAYNLKKAFMTARTVEEVRPAALLKAFKWLDISFGSATDPEATLA